MKFKKEITVTLTKHEQLSIIWAWSRKHPEVLQTFLNAKEWRCPFPDECQKFPCETLDCNADVCSNGYAYRMS